VPALLALEAAAAQEGAPLAPRDVGALLEPIRAKYALPALDRAWGHGFQSSSV